MTSSCALTCCPSHLFTISLIRPQIAKYLGVVLHCEDRLSLDCGGEYEIRQDVGQPIYLRPRMRVDHTTSLNQLVSVACTGGSSNFSKSFPVKGHWFQIYCPFDGSTFGTRRSKLHSSAMSGITAFNQSRITPHSANQLRNIALLHLANCPTIPQSRKP